MTTKLESDFSLLWDKEAEKHPAYPSFLKEMDGRAYGEEPLNNAWAWFKNGWDYNEATQSEKEDHGSPLLQSSLNALKKISQAPVPRQSLNPGIVNRLKRESLVESVHLPSPYKTIKGNVEHLRITVAGIEKITNQAAKK